MDLTFNSLHIFSSFSTNQVLRDHRTLPTFHFFKKHHQAAEQDYQVSPHASRPVLRDSKLIGDIATACLRNIQVSRFLPVNSVYTHAVKDDVAAECQDEDVWRIPVGWDGVSGCV